MRISMDTHLLCNIRPTLCRTVHDPYMRNKINALASNQPCIGNAITLRLELSEGALDGGYVEQVKFYELARWSRVRQAEDIVACALECCVDGCAENA